MPLDVFDLDTGSQLVLELHHAKGEPQFIVRNFTWAATESSAAQ